MSIKPASQGLSTFQETLKTKSKAELVKILTEEFSYPIGSARGMTKAILIDQICGAKNDREIHATITRVASKPVGLF